MLRLLDAIYFKILEEHLDASRATIISQQPDVYPARIIEARVIIHG